MTDIRLAAYLYTTGLVRELFERWKCANQLNSEQEYLDLQDARIWLNIDARKQMKSLLLFLEEDNNLRDLSVVTYKPKS